MANETTARVVHTYEREWDTDEVIQIESDYFYRRMNGGRRGSRSRQSGDGRWESDAIECRVLTRTEARRTLLDMGMEPAEVQEAIR